MSLLVFNLAMNEEDTVLGFTVGWVNEFAKHSDGVVVLSMYTGSYNVAANVKVYDIGWVPNARKAVMVANFYRKLFFILKHHHITGCFSHMQPLFTALAGPILALRGVRIVTWYAHPKVHIILKLSHLFSYKTVASVYNAYPYKKDKLVVIGQAIDTTLYTPDRSAARTKTILCAGRISPVKNIETLIRAAAILRKAMPIDTWNWRVDVVGDAPNAEGERYLRRLIHLTNELELNNLVRFLPGQKRHSLVQVYQAARVFVNLTPAGFGDKVAWEAMACGVPTLVCNPDLKETLGRYADLLFFKLNDADNLASQLLNLLQTPQEKSIEIGMYLRQQVLNLHSLEALPPKVLTLLP
jgi:glycosyltransferase involved in cell wall biosynthesis